MISEVSLFAQTSTHLHFHVSKLFGLRQSAIYQTQARDAYFHFSGFASVCS